MDDSTLAHFAHLRAHSHYTLLGGTATIAQLARRAAADGLQYLALTDAHVLYGAVALQRACAAAGIRPILGMVLNMAPPLNAAPDAGAPGQLVLLAQNPAGYRSLCALSTAVQANAQRDQLLRRGAPWEWLKQHRAGLICIEAGHAGWLARLLAQGKQAAAQYASRLGGLFEANAYVGLEIHRPPDVALARQMAAVGGRFGLRPVALQPVYCLQAEERPRLRLLAAIDHNCPLELTPHEALPAQGRDDADVHWLSPAEVAQRFAGLPDALVNVGHITQQCEPPLPDGRSIWPALDLPHDQTAEEALRAQARSGLVSRIPSSVNREPYSVIRLAVTDYGIRFTEYGTRLEHELNAIIKHGFAPLFLLVADITRFARETAVPVNTRGSVANSLVAYCLGITNVDPVAHDLLFERFLNPARANLPDIDLDLCSRRRDEVLHYVRRKYGADRVALVATISTMQPKSAVRETAKAYGLPEATIKKLMALLPRGWHPDPRRREKKSLDDILAQLDDARQQEVMRAAFDLVGQPHHLSVHPGGIVITPGPLTEIVPVQMAPKGFLITQYDHRDVEAIGLPKIDLLGIRALTVLADAADLIRERHDPAFDLAQIPMQDEETAVLLTRAGTVGVFQCESTGAQRTLRQLQVKNVADLAVANAFFKPGPATGGMARAFVRRYRGEEAVTFLHPALRPILQSTQGVLLFQEQVLRVAVEIAGLSWAQADHLRRGMSKFQAREMAAMRLSFTTGCRQKSDFSPEQAETLWQQVEAFAGYGFNQGHATAYADVSYRSAYLKAHYPAEFLCARLQDHGGFHHPAIYIAEARHLGIAVRPPHVNFSGRKFVLAQEQGSGGAEERRGGGETEYGTRNTEHETPTPDPRSPTPDPRPPTLFMGLGQVRELRRSSVRGIVAARGERPFASLRDLLERVDLQAREVTHLIQCGALDGLGESRAALLAQAAQFARAGSARQLAFDFAQAKTAAAETLAQRLEWETHLLGWPVSANPLALVRQETADDVPLRFVYRLQNQRTTVAGCRLPGWTGGSGFYFGDGDSYVVVKPARSGALGRVKAWRPLRLTGHWRVDEWGGGWFEAETAVTLGGG